MLVQEGDNTLKPPVTHYNIYHNFTSSNPFEVNINGTNITFYNVSCGSSYLVQVNAVNIIGEGEYTQIIIGQSHVHSPSPFKQLFLQLLIRR